MRFVIIGILAFLLTYITALSIGYQPSGSLILALVIIAISCVSMVAISLLVAAFIRSVFDMMTIGCFPYFILMFFSGSMIPLPPLKLITIGEKTIMVNEILPTTHSINALSKVLNSNATVVDILYELGAIIILSIVFFILGTLFFIRRHMRY